MDRSDAGAQAERAGQPGAQQRALSCANTLAFIAATVWVFLRKVQYGFENNDHQQYLLLPYREIDPGFLPGDWFTWETTHYHLTFSWLVRALHALAGEQLFPEAMLGAYGLVLAGLGAGMLALCRAAGLSRVAAWVALMLIGVVRWEALAGAAVTKGVLLPATTALPPFLLACAEWLRGRSLRCGLWLGLAGFLHANYAVVGPLALSPLLLQAAWQARSVAPVVRVALPFTLVASPTLYVVLSGFLVPDSAPAQMALFFQVRAPHHYDLTRINPLDLGWLATLLLLAAPTYLQPCRRATRNLLLALLGMLALAALGGALQSTTIVRLFLWRLSVPLCLIAALGVGDGLWRALRWPPFTPAARWGLYLSGALVLLGYSAPNSALEPASWLLLGGLVPLALATVLALSPIGGRARHLASIPALLLAAAMTLGFSASAPASFRLPTREIARELSKEHAVRARWHPGRSMGTLTAWARKHTAPDARFLVPPGFIDFRLHARRGIYVDWKCTPMRGDELVEWRRRMLRAMGTADFPSRGYALRNASTRAYLRQPASALAAIARDERMDYVVMSRPKAEGLRAGLRFVTKFGPWSVFEVPDEPR